MSHRSFIRKLRELRHCMPPNIIKKMEWTEGMRPLNRNVLAKRHNTAGKVINEMMKYIVDRVMDGDICMLPRNKTYIFVGHNAPTAIERMKNRRDYPYKPGIIPGFIKVSRDDGEHSYMSLLLSLKDKQRLIDKVNSGIKYVQPIPLHTSYDNRNTWNEKVAWKKLTAEKQKIEECSTLTWTI